MRVLAFGIHPDDVELGCGGTVALASSQGHEVVIVDLSLGESASNGTPDERSLEAEEAARILGSGRRLNLGFPDTAISSENGEQMRRVVDCIRTIRPEVVLIPSKVDPHPDHASGGELIERSLYFSGVDGYRTGSGAWSVPVALVYMGREDFAPHLIVDVTPTYGEKVRAIEAHRSQFFPDEGRKRTPLNASGFLPALEARALVLGRRIGVRYGEALRSLKPLALSDFSLFRS